MSAPMAQTREGTINKVIRDYNRRLFGFIRGRVPSNDDAEDVLQEVWYQLSRVVDIDSIEQISAWLFRVARNTLTDRYRKKRPDLLDDQLVEDEGGERFIRDLLLDDTPGPEMEYLRELFWEELMEALDELPAKQRDIFIWNELEGQTFQEISDRTGTNIKTLISRKRYAVAHLRQRLALLYEEFLAT